MSITSIPPVVPYNRYSFNDTFGGNSDPLRSPDADALISQDLEGEPWLRHSREFDIFGRQGSVRHLLRLLLSLHDRHLYLRWRHLYTGVLINHQEDGRLEEGENGHEFYVAETDNNLRIATSPIEDLTNLKARLKSVKRLPHDNSLYARGEQFRSKYVPILLAREPRYEELLEEVGPDVIPDDRQKGILRISYADRFGNLLAWKEGGVEDERERLRERIGKTIGVRFGTGPQQEIEVAGSLAEAKPGAFSVYPNDANIDVVGKWWRGESEEEKRQNSAYRRAGKPIENVTPVQFDW